MKFTYDENVRPLNTLTDDELLKIVDLYAIDMLQVNAQEVIKVETQLHEVPDVSEIYFKITTQHRDDQTLHPQRVFGFAISFWSEDFDNLRFTPFSQLTYFDSFLNEVGITDHFASHWLSIDKVYKLFHEDLRIWDKTDAHPTIPNTTIEHWHEVEGIEVLDHY
ncbi:MAG: hypothetical protein AAGC65_07785 [Mucilaginibacter sp.]|uniref:hypothetical protein n=1 Tax=Mucilaginibacter sp. TaxID=1882438 RepID=UPI0031B0E81A